MGNQESRQMDRKANKSKQSKVAWNRSRLHDVSAPRVRKGLRWAVLVLVLVLCFALLCFDLICFDLI